MDNDNVYIRGRGSQLNPANKFNKQHSELYLDDLATEEERLAELQSNPKTTYTEVFPKTILNKVESPDLRFSWSMNPYQGCEHGCVYCYARNTHEYWGFSAGADFEEKILYKPHVAELLRQSLLKKSWKPEAITIAGNTDCYQPAERKLKITRECLQVFRQLKHPVGIITKNSMVERDADIIAELASENLVWVVMSLTTLDEDLKRMMEPRTSSVRSVLRTIRTLSDAGIPVHLNLAPVIPGLNDEHIFKVMEAAAEAGALNASYIVARLNGHIGKIFEDWLRKNFPDRANKVLHQIESMHGGRVNDTQYGRRMKGEGKFAELVKSQFDLAKKKFFAGKNLPELNFGLFEEQRKKILSKNKHQPGLFDDQP